MLYNYGDKLTRAGMCLLRAVSIRCITEKTNGYGVCCGNYSSREILLFLSLLSVLSFGYVTLGLSFSYVSVLHAVKHCPQLFEDLVLGDEVSGFVLSLPGR